MSNWLITTPAAIDNSTPLSAKWKNTIPVVGQQKVPLQIIVPAISQADVAYSLGIANIYFPYQCCQFNYTAPEPFTLPTIQDGPFNDLPLIFFIRYRVGTKNYRYSISPVADVIEGTDVIGPKYIGQIILPQFTIEGYLLDAPVSPWSDFPGATLNTSIMYVTSPPNQVVGFAPVPLNPAGPLLTDLYHSLPITLPNIINWNPLALWNSN